MYSIKNIQNLQLRLVESASVNDSCAHDLFVILRKLNIAEATNVVGIINLLHSEAQALRVLSREMIQHSVSSSR